MVQEDITFIKGKIISGVLALTTRNFLLNFFSLVANFILTVLLTPAIFGIFFVVSAVISFLSYFSDVGLAAALIQKKEEPTREELVSAFTLQQILVLTVVIAVFLFSPLIGQFYHLDENGIFLLKSLLISFFLSSLKTIPSVILERKLEFGLLAIPQIIETLVYYIVAIILALFGPSATNFAWAALLRGIVGLVIIYFISPWPISIGLSRKAIKHLVSFGIPFQTNSLLALIKDDLMTLFLGKLIPLSQLGYIGWAKKWAESSLRIIMDSVIRVTFPVYSRLQDNKEILGKALEKTVFFLALFIFPSTFLLILFIKPLVYFIPKYSKWDPALFSFYLFAISSIFSAFSTPLVNALNSIGKIKVSLSLMIMWTFLTWILVPLSVFYFGFNGVAIATLFISFTSVLPAMLLKRSVSFKVAKSIYKPLISSIIMIIPVYILLQQSTDVMISLLVSLFLASILYCIFIFFFMKSEIRILYPHMSQVFNKIFKH